MPLRLRQLHKREGKEHREGEHDTDNRRYGVGSVSVPSQPPDDVHRNDEENGNHCQYDQCNHNVDLAGAVHEDPTFCGISFCNPSLSLFCKQVSCKVNNYLPWKRTETSFTCQL